MIKYRTSRYEDAKIQVVEILRETPSTVIFMEDYGRMHGPRETKELKSTDGHKWHNTWEEAYSYLMSRASDSLIGARSRLQRAQDIIDNIKGMKSPSDPNA